MTKNLPDGDYTLTDGTAWFTVGNASIRIAKTKDGVAADIYVLNDEANSALGSAYVLDSDLIKLEDERA